MTTNLRTSVARTLAFALTIALGLMSARHAAAQQMMPQLKAFGKNVAKALRDDGTRSVRLSIEGSASMPSSGPAMIREVLATELHAGQIKIERLRAPVTILGKIKMIELPRGGAKVEKLVLQLVLNFVDRNDSPILNLDKKINVTDLSEISQLLGLPFESHPGQRAPDGSTAEGDGRGGEGAGGVVDGFVNPNQQVTGQSVIRARGSGEFGIEVIANGIPRNAAPDGGLAFVELVKDDKCEIRLINDADYEVAVQLTLDGVDCFWFTKSRSGLWLVPPHKSITVKGWQLNEKRAREFMIVPFEQSVAAQLGPAGKFGVIAASFRRAYPKGTRVPDNDRAVGTKRIGIGGGDEFANNIQYVQRELGRVRATVPVRYEKPRR